MENDQRFRAIFEQQAALGMSRVAFDGKLLEVNQRLCEITGYSRDELLARTFQQLTHPDDLPRDADAAQRLISGELQTYSVEKRYIHKDGHVVWVKLSVSVARDSQTSKPLYFISVADDVTEYKLAQQALRAAEEKCSKAFRETPTTITITSAKDHRYIEINEAFESLTGYRRAEVIGRTPFDLGIWVNPAERADLVRRLLAGESIRNEEYPFRIKDGTIRTALNSAELIEIDGETCVLTVALDITDRKRVEETLQELSAELINTQEEDRKRISVALNDIVGQSVALLTLELAQVARTARGELARKLQKLYAEAQNIASEIGSISHGLHPSTLEYVGLPRAIEDLCREFGKLYGLQVAFKHQGVPTTLCPDIALCLYRIAQEGLQNVALHSGTREAWIELVGCAGSVRLALWDKGSGFNITAVKSGLGLVTMRERCRLVNGELSVQAHSGTRIEARIPLRGEALGAPVA